MSDVDLDHAGDEAGADIRRPMRGRPPNAAKLTNADDPRARAMARAAEIRAQREGRDDDSGDEFRAPPAPDGWEYMWRTKSVMNEPQISHMNNLLRNGWSEVPASRHPEFLPYGTTDSRTSIEHRGMVLMECPKDLVDDARRRDKRNAFGQIESRSDQMKRGSTDTLDGDRRASKFSKSYEPLPANARPMAIPD